MFLTLNHQELEISKGSIIEIEAALDRAQAPDYFQVEDVELLGMPW